MSARPRSSPLSVAHLLGALLFPFATSLGIFAVFLIFRFFNLGLAELAHSLAQAPGELGQALGSEYEEHDEEK